jgi:hypothetical protein
MPLTPYGGDGGSNWLQSLLASYGAGQPNDPRQNPSLTPTAGMPGGGLMGMPAATPGGPSMGYPAMGQPSAQPPPAAAQGQPPGSPMFQFGGVHPGNILQSHPPGSASLGPVFNASGSPGGPGAGPGGPGTAGNDGGFNNPYMAAAGATAPQQPGPMDPSIMARQSAMQPNYPSWATPGPAGSSGTAHAAVTMANAPPGQPSATPRPARPYSATPASAYAPLPPPRPKDLGVAGSVAPSRNKNFGTVQYQVPGGGGPLSRNPIYTALNLFGARS